MSHKTHQFVVENLRRVKLFVSLMCLNCDDQKLLFVLFVKAGDLSFEQVSVFTQLFSIHRVFTHTFHFASCL